MEIGFPSAQGREGYLQLTRVCGEGYLHLSKVRRKKVETCKFPFPGQGGNQASRRPKAEFTEALWFFKASQTGRPRGPRGPRRPNSNEERRVKKGE